MDNLFKIRALTAAVNKMVAPARRIYNRYFQPKEHLEPTDRLAFDIITGSERLLGNISVVAPATVTGKTGRQTVTMTAPRLSHKRVIHASDLNALRAYGQQTQVELMATRLAIEQRDMRNMVDRTMEYWACGALKGQIYDADLSTVLVDYGMAATHTPTLTGTNLWTNASSKPVERLRSYMKTIEDDSYATITGWEAWVGSSVMDALLSHSAVLDLLKYQGGVQIAETGRISLLAGVRIEEYNASFTDSEGNRKRMIDEDRILLIGLCDDLVDTPYAPIVDHKAPGGVGNTDANGAGVMFYSASWEEEDPPGRWIKVEARPLPVLQRPGAVIYAKVV
ncbi:MAG: major capsid protein [Thermodesulfobacteriota bacterium]